MNQKNIEFFIKKSNNIFGEWFDFSESIYINNSTDLKVVCPIHGCFKIIPNNFYKQGCSKCRRELKTKKIINKAIKKHGAKIDYSMVPKNAVGDDVVQLSCSIHGPFTCVLKSHIKTDSGCPLCSPTRKFTEEEIIDKSNLTHRNKYDYPLPMNYVDVDHEINICCPKHGLFTKTPYNHINLGQGCPRCTRYVGEATIDKFLVENNISFETQKRFEDCRNKKPLPFDFYILDKNLLIEYDGTPHFKPIDVFGGQEYFEVVQKHDKIKTDYCLKEGIILERINYKENIVDRLKEIL